MQKIAMRFDTLHCTHNLLMVQSKVADQVQRVNTAVPVDVLQNLLGELGLHFRGEMYYTGLLA